MNRTVVRSVVVAVVVLWVVWFFHPSLAARMQISTDAAVIGQWGDSFGALNALMSGLAFAAVFYTIRLQQGQIDSTQRDQHIQRFENSYFELLRLFREVRESVQYRYSSDYVREHRLDAKRNIRVEGQEAIRRANFAMVAELRAKPMGAVNSGVVAAAYESVVLDRYESTTSPYFRMMYTMLARIRDDDVLTARERRKYANLFRSQLSSHEVALAGYNGLSPISKDLSELIVEFRLLKYLPDDFGKEFLEMCYPAEAFADRPD